MKRFWAPLALVAVVAGCVVSHVTRPVPPPGGCDVCHRVPIGGGWRIAWTPVQWEEGAPVADRPPVADVESRFLALSLMPVHSEVPAGKLKVFAAELPPDALDEGGTGTRCFACHEAPDVKHAPLRGLFIHPPIRNAPAKPR